MARIGRPGVLGVLDRLFAFDSQVKSPERVTVEGSVSVVHDVSRQVERGAAFGRFGGYLMFGGANVHAAANTQVNNCVPVGSAAILFGVPESQLAVWLIDQSVWALVAGVANITSYQTTVAYPETFSAAPYGPGGKMYRPLLYGVGAGFSTAADGAGASTIAVALKTSTTEALPWVPPLYLPPGTYLTQRSVSAGAVDINFGFLCWVGRAGTTPPGLA